MALRFYVDIFIVLRKPSDLKEVGQEALELASVFSRLTGNEKKAMTQPVRDGYLYNFQQEGTPGEPWRRLARITREDRQALIEEFNLPITPEHPILVRWGDYRDSWTKLSHPKHVLMTVDYPWDVDTNLLALVEVLTGSMDPRVPKLAGGEPDEGWEPPQATLPEFEGMIGMNPPPPRPLKPIDEMFTKRIETYLEALVEGKAGGIGI